MNEFPTNNPTEFCEAFTRSELADLKESQIWFSWHPVMERILSRTNEMEHVYDELISFFGYSTKYTNPALWLTLEAIWASGKLFNKDSISKKRQVNKELIELHEKIPQLAFALRDALERQRELLETEDFRPGEWTDIVELISWASEDNGHYNGWVKDDLENLNQQFDGKYWPEPEGVVSAIGEFELSRGLPVQGYIPEDAMSGRTSIIKDFVLGFEAAIKKADQIPKSFAFSNSAVASIANVVLDLPPDKLATADAVRVVRNRYKDKIHTKT